MRLLAAHRSALVEFGMFAASVAAAQGGRFAYSLAVAATVPLTDFNTWALFLAAVAYAPALLLGVVNGMGRQVPYLVGAGRLAEARRAEAATWWTLAGVIGALAAAGAAATGTLRLDAMPVAWTTLAFALSLIFQVQQFVSRSHLRFNRASAQQLLLGVGTLAATGWLASRGVASFADVAAAYAAAVAVAVVAGVILARPAVAAFDADAWRGLINIGFPIMAAGALFTVLVTTDRWVATVALGPKAAAPYALASVVGSAMLVLPTVLSQQTYPRMALAYGAAHDDAATARLASLQGRLTIAVSLPIAVIVTLVAAVAIPSLLPAYRDAVLPIALVCGGYVALAAFLGYGNYLNVTGRQWRYLAAMLIAFAAGGALMVAGATLGGVSGIALGMAITLAGYGILLRLAASSGRRDRI